MAYSTDLRKRVLGFIETGGKKAEAARRFSVNRSTIYRWLAAKDPTTRQKTGPKKMRCLDEAALKKHVADFPDLTQNERASHFGVSEASIGYGLRKLGITRKKKTLGYKERCDEKRQVYRQALAEKHATGKKIVYVDECGFRAERYRCHGYALKGEPVFGLVSGTRTRTTTLVAARIDSHFTAPCLFDGSCNAACFNAWLEAYLCPRLSVSDVVVLDNAKIHKTRRTRELIEASGAEILFLPPYSPDYNPIEHDFANIKRLREYNADITIDEVINMYH